MEIFGFILSASDLWLLGIAGALILVFLAAYLPAAISRRHAASDAYLSAFSDVLLNLRENPDCPLAQIAHGCNAQIISAIDKQRSKIPFYRRKRFESDVVQYKAAYQEATQYGSVLAVAMSGKNDFARQNRAHFLQAIEKLLSHV